MTVAILGSGALVGLPAASASAAGSPHARGPAPITVVGHRGAPAYAPENTLPSVDEAARLGFRWVENDVQRTKDGELVVLHDTTLTRTTDVEQVFPDRAPWNVRDFTAAEIARLDAGTWYDPSFAGTRVPTLEQYLSRISRTHQSLILELKSPDLYPGIEAETLARLRDSGWLDRAHVRNRLVVQSFDAKSIKEVHKQRPDVKTGFLGTPAQARLPEYARFADQINPSHTTIDADWVAAAHALKGPHDKPLEVFTWTVDTPADTVAAADKGVDGIISNAPDVVRGALGGDGLGGAPREVPGGAPGEAPAGALDGAFDEALDEAVADAASVPVG
ncbi:glycerophosphodiesterase [Streptomyces sp. SPB074]|nr:glycerophosphodiesterase [Streptomyces sp. SPB074]